MQTLTKHQSELVAEHRTVAKSARRTYGTSWQSAPSNQIVIKRVRAWRGEEDRRAIMVGLHDRFNFKFKRKFNPPSSTSYDEM